METVGTGSGSDRAQFEYLMRFLAYSILVLLFCTACFPQAVDTDRAKTDKPDSPLQILYKPKAKYPKQDGGTICVRGTVTLRVEFRFDGSIGKIAVIKGLPYGLTESAIEAAKKMRFAPEIKGGYYITTNRPVSFTFEFY